MSHPTYIYVVTLPYRAFNKSDRSMQRFFSSYIKAHKFIMSEVDNDLIHQKIYQHNKVWRYYVQQGKVGNIIRKELE